MHYSPSTASERGVQVGALFGTSSSYYKIFGPTLGGEFAYLADGAEVVKGEIRARLPGYIPPRLELCRY